MQANPQAADLNAAIEAVNPTVARLLSRRGQGIFFPSKGIIRQSADAKGATINATIGSALEDSGEPMVLDVLRERAGVEPRLGFSYAPPHGRPELREAWQKALFAKNPSLAGAAISKPVVTCALTHGLSMAAYLFVDEADEVIVPELYWENYNLVFGNTYGAQMSTYPTFVNDGFNVEGLRAALGEGQPGKRIVLLNFPNNPTGYTVTVEEAERIRQVLTEAAEAGNDVLVLIDDAYFGLIYEEGVLRESMFALLANAHERVLAVKLDGPTKEDYVWGFRVGFATFGSGKNSPELYDALIAKLAGAIRGTVSNVPNISQSLLAAGYTDERYEAQRKAKYQTLERRYRSIREILAAHPEYADIYEPLPCNSGYFMCVAVKEGIDAEAVRRRLLAGYATGVIAFGSLLRIAFSSAPLDSLPVLFDNLYQAGRDVRAGG